MIPKFHFLQKQNNINSTHKCIDGVNRMKNIPFKKFVECTQLIN